MTSISSVDGAWVDRWMIKAFQSATRPSSTPSWTSTDDRCQTTCASPPQPLHPTRATASPETAQTQGNRHARIQCACVLRERGRCVPSLRKSRKWGSSWGCGPGEGSTWVRTTTSSRSREPTTPSTRLWIKNHEIAVSAPGTLSMRHIREPSTTTIACMTCSWTNGVLASSRLTARIHEGLTRFSCNLKQPTRHVVASTSRTLQAPLDRMRQQDSGYHCTKQLRCTASRPTSTEDGVSWLPTEARSHVLPSMPMPATLA
mmetsp:Transcript_21643/g.42001  ORF Transcript_21643/g.42001 Transcript_21643/m.42001 type:complete len:259 (-) Transcript_21643:859-1635(-)